MITGAMAYRFLQQENPAAGTAVRAMLEKHSWVCRIAGGMKSQDLLESQRSEALFMWPRVGPMTFRNLTLEYL